MSIVLSTTQPGLRQQCYEKPIPLWNPPPGKAHQRKQTPPHTHIKKIFAMAATKQASNAILARLRQDLNAGSQRHLCCLLHAVEASTKLLARHCLYWSKSHISSLDEPAILERSHERSCWAFYRARYQICIPQVWCDYVYLSNILFELYTESHQTYRTIHHTSNNANTCTKCKASVKGSSPSHVSIVLSTTQPGLRQPCYEKDALFSDWVK